MEENFQFMREGLEQHLGSINAILILKYFNSKSNYSLLSHKLTYFNNISKVDLAVIFTEELKSCLN